MIKTGYSYTPDVPRFSRRWWLGVGRNMLWVGIVTVLIWVYADMEFIDDRPFDADIQLVTSASQSLVLLSPSKVAVRFKLRGNRASLDDFQRALAEKNGILEYDPSIKFGPGEHPIDTRDILEQSASLSKRGLSVVSVSLGRIDAHLDRRVGKKVPVEFNPTGGILDGPAKIEPTTVTAYLPDSRWKQVGPDPTVRTVLVDLSKVASDKPFPVELIRAVDGVPAELDRTTVQVTVKVQQLTGVKTIRVAVRVVVPYTWLEDGTWENYDFKRKNPANWVQKITVSGPKGDLKDLDAEHVDAYIVLTDAHRKPAADAGATYSEATVQFRFPEKLRVKLVGEPPKLQFRLEKRKSPPT